MQLEPHQRMWDGTRFHAGVLPVDKNLKNDSLERLNRLCYLELTNICEGHTHIRFGTGQERHPHLTLHFRESFLAIAEKHKAALENLFKEVFPNDPDRNQIDCSSSGGLMTIRSPRDRQRDHPEPEMERWFDETVAAIEQFDSRCRAILDGCR
jgi:hypothetical protein